MANSILVDWMKAEKITARKVRLILKTGNLGGYPLLKARFMLTIVSSGSSYTGSYFNITSYTQYNRDWTFSDSVNSWVRWWVQMVRRDTGQQFYVQEGDRFYVPM